MPYPLNNYPVAHNAFVVDPSLPDGDFAAAVAAKLAPPAPSPEQVAQEQAVRRAAAETRVEAMRKKLGRTGASGQHSQTFGNWDSMPADERSRWASRAVYEAAQKRLAGTR